MRSRLSGLFDHLSPENELMTSQTFNMFTFQKHLTLECARMDLELVLLVSGFKIGGLCEETKKHVLHRIWPGLLFLIIIAVSLILICFVN